jgi:PAS domain S-box-containing protein
MSTGETTSNPIEPDSEAPQREPADQGEQFKTSMEHRALQLQTVADISRATSSILYLGELLSTTVQVIRDRFNLCHVAIFLLDQTKRYALLKAGTGDIGKRMLESNYRFDIEDSSLISRCLNDCQAHIAFYEGKDGVVTGNHLLSQTRSEILLPLAHQGRTIGVMTIQSEEPAAFSFEDIPVFQTMADQVSNAIENARLFEQMADARHQAETRLHEMQIMQRISSAVTGTFDLTKVVDALFNALSNEMGFTFISLNIIDEAAGEMRNVRAVGLAKKLHGLVRPLEKLAGDILMDVIKKGSIEVIDGWDNRLDREIYDREGHAELVRAFVPLLSRGKSIGVLEAGYNRAERSVITPEEVRLLNGLAEQTAITVENTRLLQQLNQERDLLHTLMDNIPDAIYFKDNKSRFLRASKALARKIGLSDPADLIGKTDFDLFTKEHAQQAFEDEQRILRTAVPEIGIEEKETWPDARITWVSTTKMPLRDKSGRIIGTFGVSREITKSKSVEDALKRAEEKLQHANNVLELRVAERTGDLKKTNELLKTHIEQLNFLNSSVYELSPIITIDKLLPVILNAFMTRFPQAQGGLCLHSGDRFHCMCATAALESEHNRSCLEEAALCLTGAELLRPLFIEDRTADERLSHISWTGIEELLCVVAIPLIVDNGSKVLLQIMTNKEYAGIYALEQTLLTTLAAHAAICLSNALHYQQRAEKARLDGELDAARSIQRRFTPQHRPDIPHLNLTGVYYPAYEVGGDYLDYFQTEEGNWVVAVADVCGKGIPAALLMTTMRSAFRVEAKNETSARRLLCAVNKFMAINLDDKSFVTALCLIIARDGSTMSYARAGHQMLLKLGRNGEVPENIVCGGIALGLMRETHAFAGMMEEKIIPLVAGDRYLVYTDGLIDASDTQKNSYGFARLQTLLSRDRDSEPEQLINGIMADIKSFTHGAPYNDDLTILALRVY